MTIAMSKSDQKSKKVVRFRIWWLLLIPLLMSVADVVYQNPKTLAVVEDDVSLAEGVGDVLSEGFMPGDYDIFPTCEALLAKMATGTRYLTYVTDTYLGSGLNGWQCAEQILKLHPGALIIGASSLMDAELRQQYADVGVEQTLDKPANYLEWFWNLITGN